VGTYFPQKIQQETNIRSFVRFEMADREQIFWFWLNPRIGKQI
jgi:hypothetical protein